MKTPTTCTMRKSIDRHFSGKIDVPEETSMRQHLSDCQDCREYYQRHLALASLDPKGLSAKERLGRGLGLVPPRISWWLPSLVAATAAAVVLGLVIFAPWKDHRDGSKLDSEFVSRGNTLFSEPAHLYVYKFQKDGSPVLVKEEIQYDDELMFAYELSVSKKWLMVFGIDEQHRVYWYYPAWLDEKENPNALLLDNSSGVHELPQAVRHNLQGKTLVIYGWFVDQQVSVREVESLLQNQPVQNVQLPLPGAVMAKTILQVTH